MASTDKKPNSIQGMGPGSEDAVDYATGPVYNGLSRDAIEGAQNANQSKAASLTIEGLSLPELAQRVAELETRILNMTIPPPSAPMPPETLAATMVGGIFNCPECGLRITSPALISTHGVKSGGFYEHPFDDSPRLKNQKCRLIGRKFKSPVVHLELIPVAPAPQKLDVQETIGV